MKKIIIGMLSCLFLTMLLFNSNLNKKKSGSGLSLKNLLTMTKAFGEGAGAQYCPSTYTVTYSGTSNNIYVVCTPGGSYECPLCGIA